VVISDSVRAVDCNSAWRQLVGWTADRAWSEAWLEVIHPGSRRDARASIAEAMKHSGIIATKWRLADRDETAARLVEARIRKAPNGDVVVAMWDAAAPDRREAELRTRSTHDPLTGLLNRNGLADRARTALARLGRAPRPLSLIRVDLDGFARTNEDFGPGVADRLLVAVAAALAAAVRPGDTIARLGRDDFGVLCEEISEKEALAIAQRLRDAIPKPIDFGVFSMEVDVSVSVAHVRDATDSFESLLDRAGRGLYFARHARRRARRHGAVEAHSSSVDARVLIVDEHQLVAESLMLALQQHGLNHVALARNVTQQGVRTAAADFGPDVALVVSDLGQGARSASLSRLLTAMGVIVVIVTGGDESEAAAIRMEAGAAGVVDKSRALEDLMVVLNHAAMDRAVMRPSDREELRRSVQTRSAPGELRLAPFTSLTMRERTVLALMMNGKSAEGISQEHNVSLATVRTQIRAILQKLGVKSQVAAVALAVRADWNATDRRAATPPRS